MSELTVRIVELPSLRVASALGFGQEPEDQAWKKILTFLDEKGLRGGMAEMKFYGFNNPDPSHGSPNYGYEQWVVVPDDVEATEDVEIKTFPGGKYAVTRCTGIPNLPETWMALRAWREDSPHLYGSHQWLEQWVNPSAAGMDVDTVEMDLFMPISD
ncbi:GyrI-like domain-containing protein [bacterium]|nr:GyrI-like domain-containing protein [bacterium]